MKLCLSFLVTSDEVRRANRDVKLRKRKKGRQSKCWMSGTCCLIFVHLLPPDDSASPGERWLCNSCNPCPVIPSTDQVVTGFLLKQLKLVGHLALNYAYVLPRVCVFLLQCGMTGYTKNVEIFFSWILCIKYPKPAKVNTLPQRVCHVSETNATSHTILRNSFVFCGWKLFSNTE